MPPCRPDRQQLGAYPASIGSEKGDAFRRLLSLSKSLFDKLSNANRGAGFAFEKAARCGAHNLCAACAQIPHLHPVMCFVRCTRHRTKQIDILFAPAGANSTRFFDKLKGDAFPRLLIRKHEKVSKINVFKGREHGMKSKNLILTGTKGADFHISALFLSPRHRQPPYGVFSYPYLYPPEKCIN